MSVCAMSYQGEGRGERPEPQQQEVPGPELSVAHLCSIVQCSAGQSNWKTSGSGGKQSL